MSLPDRAALLAHIEANPERSGKREIAKAFGLKGADRIALKHMLRELADEGTISARGKRHVRPGSLPPVSVFDIVERNTDGELVAHHNGEDATPVLVRLGKKGETVGVGDRILARTSLVDGAWTVRPIKRLERNRRRTLGVFRQVAEDGRGRIEPVERKDREHVVEGVDANGAKDGDLVEIAVDTGRYGVQRARVVEVVGSMRSERAVSMIAIHAHGIPHVFPEAAIREAEAAEPATADGREDWTHLPFATIDPATAKDHDDAVAAEPIPDGEPGAGGFVVRVAIADVAFYVRPGSAMDREARLRGNSVYFPDRVVPMLPERISNDLCSLRENEDRAAIAVAMRYGPDGAKIGHSFHRVLIRSRASLAYEEAQAAADGNASERAAAIQDTFVEPVWAAYRLLRAAREKRAPLEIDAPERRLVLDERGEVESVHVPPRLDAHRLIEEFMIQANVAAAETLERKDQPLVYRVHEPPTLAKLESLRQFLQTLDIPLAKSGQLRPHHFNAILAQVRDTEFALMVNQVVLRSQSQAVYDPENAGHFGLNLQRYAHFTSPIRRYADLLVHRGLVRALALGPGGMEGREEQELVRIAEEISQTERRAMAAERDTLDRLIAMHLADRIGATFTATVNGATKSGLFVTLDETGADGFVPIGSLADEYMLYDETIRAVVGQDSGTGWQAGDPVTVKLVEAQPMAGSLLFEMESEPKRIDARDTGRHKERARNRGRKPTLHKRRSAGRGRQR